MFRYEYHVRIPRRVMALMLVGSGLMLVGLIAMYLVYVQKEQEALQPTDFSAIPAPVHYAAPSLQLSDLTGTKHSLADYRGKVVLVNLWATWCPPCQAEMPLLQKYYDKHRQDGFAVIGIEDGEPIGDVAAFVKQYALTFPIWLDPKHQATDVAFKTMNLPTSYVIDRDGQVKLAWYGAISEGNLEKYITPLIQER